MVEPTIINARKPSLWWSQGLTLVEGCTRCSSGCADCWALALEKRTGRAVEGGEIRLRWDRLGEPLYWRKPRVVAVWNDLFHEGAPFACIDALFGVIALCPQHRFIVLTKRPQRIGEWLSHVEAARRGYVHEHQGFLTARLGEWCDEARIARGWETMKLAYHGPCPATSIGDATAWPWPLANVILGVTCESNKYLWRVEELLLTPAACRFVNAHLLWPLDLRSWYGEWHSCRCGCVSQGVLSACPECGVCKSPSFTKPGIGWLAIECNRPFRGSPAEWWGWCKALVEDATAAGVPVWVKQGPLPSGAVTNKLADFPVWARQREFPKPKGAEL